MKLWFIAIAAIAAFCYVPNEVMFRENTWRLERIPGMKITELEAERILAETRRKIEAASSAGVYTPEQKYAVDEALWKILLGMELPESYVIPGTTIIAYADESEGAPKFYWEVYNLETASMLAARGAGWGAAEEANYQALCSRPEVRHIWHPRLKKYPKGRYAASLVRERIWPAIMVVLAFALWKLARLGWVVRRLFSRKSLQFAGYLISAGLSLCAAPAAAQQLISKLRKEKSQAGETIERPLQLPVPAGGSPQPKGEFAISVHSDLTHDRQENISASLRVTGRVGLAFFNQNRQSATAPGALTFAGLGVKLRLARSFSLTALAGPQYEWTKGSIDQQALFVNGTYSSSGATVSVINRFSRGVDQRVAPAHRHAVSVRAGAMPSWLSIQAELKATKGIWTESFWGAQVGYGKWLPKRVRNRLSGLYAWPHYDFIKRSWDIRFGYSHSFAF